MAEQFEKLSQLDFRSMTVGDLSNLRDTILRSSLIDEVERADVLELQVSHQNHGSHSDHVTHQNGPRPVEPFVQS